MRNYSTKEYPLRSGYSDNLFCRALDLAAALGGEKAQDAYRAATPKSIVKLTTRKYPTNGN